MAGVVLLAWFGGLVFVMINLVRPVWVFRSRLQALFIGIPALFVALVAIGNVSSPTPTVARDDTVNEAGVTEPSDQENVPSVEPKPVPVVALPSNRLGISALTHFHDGLKQRITYHEPKFSVLDRNDVDPEVWTLEADDTEITCFEDGNNAVFFTEDDRLIAANGKARQFTNFDDGDGAIGADDRLIKIHEPDRGRDYKLIDVIIKRGLDLCGRKTMPDVVENPGRAGQDGSTIQAERPAGDDSVFLDAAFAIKGGEYCGFELSASALVDYLDSHQITMDRFKAEIETYLIIVAGMMGTKPDDAFCPDLIWPRYGPDGFGFLTK